MLGWWGGGWGVAGSGKMKGTLKTEATAIDETSAEKPEAHLQGEAGSSGEDQPKHNG